MILSARYKAKRPKQQEHQWKKDGKEEEVSEGHGKKFFFGEAPKIWAKSSLPAAPYHTTLSYQYIMDHNEIVWRFTSLQNFEKA